MDIKYWLVNEKIHVYLQPCILKHYIVPSACGERAIAVYMGYSEYLFSHTYSTFNAVDPYDWMCKRKLYADVTLETICYLNSAFGLALIKSIDAVITTPTASGFAVGIKKDFFLNDIVPRMTLMESFSI